MKDLVINGETTLCIPDEDGDVIIDTSGEMCEHCGRVSFEVLEKWVSSIREQMITNATGATECYCETAENGDWPCKYCMTHPIPLR